MRRILGLAAMMLGAALQVFGQAGVHTNVALTTGSGSPFATVRVCPLTSTGTNCTPTSSIFSDAAETQPLGNPMSADQFGNYSFWAAPGFYLVQVTALSQSTPYFIYVTEVDADPLNPTFVSVTLTGPITQNNQAVTKLYVDTSISAAISALPHVFYQTMQFNGTPVTQRNITNVAGPYLEALDQTGPGTTLLFVNVAGIGGTLLADFGTSPGASTSLVGLDGNGNLRPAPTNSYLTSFNGRSTSAAVPATNDYSFAQISGVIGDLQFQALSHVYPIQVTEATHLTNNPTETTCGVTSGNAISSVAIDSAANIACAKIPVPTVTVQEFVTAACAAASGTYETCTINGNWPTPFVDAAYAVSCSAIDANAGPGASTNESGIIYPYNLTASGLSVWVQNNRGSFSFTPSSIQCIGVHP